MTLNSLTSPVRLLTVALLSVLALLVGAADRPEPAPPAKLSQRQASWAQHQKLKQESWFQGLPWRSVGPVVQGGRVVDIEGVPGDPSSFYVAYASGGLWRTRNNGHDFVPLFDHEATIIMGAIAVDPQRPKVVWVGTGESNSSRSSYGGFGVYKSTDEGKSWEHMGLAESDRIGRIVVDPQNSDHVLVAALGKLYTGGGQRGVYRTTDGGSSWQQVLPGSGMTGAIDLVIDPKDPKNIYAAMWTRSRRPWNFVEAGSGSGVFRSRDGGETWTRLEGGFPQGEDVGRIGLALCSSQPRTLYACVDNQELLPEEDWDLGDSSVTAKRLRNMTKEEFLAQDPEVIESFIRSSDLQSDLDAEKLIGMIEEDEITIADVLADLDDANASLFQTDIRGLEVYRSDDGGDSWRLTHDEPLHRVVNTYGYYFGLVAVSPDNPDQVYVAGVPILRSDDGGESWENILGRGMHVDHHALWIDPQNPDKIICGNDGGVDMSYDRGGHWWSVDRQAVGQFYTLAVDMSKPYNIYGGLQDNGTLKGSSRARPGRDKWSFLGGGDGMYVQVDGNDGGVYIGYQFGFYTHIAANGKRHSVRPRDVLGEEALRYNWSTPIQLSSHNPDIVYFGSNRLYRSMDEGMSWTPLGPDLSRSKERGDVPFACITTLDESTLEFGLLWVGTDDGHVYVTEGGSDDALAERVAGLPTDRWVTRVIASRTVRERAYVCLSGYRDDDIASYVYVTEDLGRTWHSIASNLPAESVNVIEEDPVNDQVLYVGTDRGVYVSLDRGGAWQSLMTELPSVPVHDLLVHPRDRELVAATHGRSVYVLDALPIQELDEELTAESVAIFPVEKVRFSRGWRSQRSRWYYDPEDDPERSIPIWCGAEGTVSLEVLTSKGEPLRRMEVPVSRGIQTITWDLLLDPELAIPVEQARQEEEPKEEDEPEESETESGDSAAAGSAATEASDIKGTLAKTPWQEALRLGYPLYVTPGDYKLRVTLGDSSVQTKLVVDKPRKRDPRVPPESKIRGQDDDD